MFDGFKRLREKDIANDGRKLLSLERFCDCLRQIMEMRFTEEVPMRPANFPDCLWAGADAGWLRWRRVCAALVFAAAFACLAQDGRPAVAVAGQTNPASQASGSASNDAKPQADSPNDSGLQKGAPAESERKRQISDESTRLLAMAIALKAEVDKTSKDTLSLNVIRKADEIERLAKTVKEKMKQGSGPG
jgi:hypothetical protein